jgi:competence protein ComEC
VKNRTSHKKKNKLIYSIIASVVVLAGTLLHNSNFDIQKKAVAVEGNQANSTMEVHFIDVGQADCILIESAGEYMLIDAGNNEDGTLVTNYLKEEGVSKLKYVITTHPHEDHIGGMDDVINSFPIDTIFMPDVVHTTKTFEDVLTAISENNLEITIPETGEQYWIGNANFIMIAPNRNDYGDNLNNYSIGIKLVNGSNSFLMCGDAEEEAETDILNNGIDISAQVYKASHHGSSTGTSEEFLEAISPGYAVITCGAENDYGHPHKETLEKFEDMGIEVYRTDLNGTIVAVSNGIDITFTSKE